MECWTNCICNTKIENEAYFKFEDQMLQSNPQEFEDTLTVVCIRTGSNITLQCDPSTGKVKHDSCEKPECKANTIENKHLYGIEHNFDEELSGKCRHGSDYKLTCNNGTIDYTEPCEDLCEDTVSWKDSNGNSCEHYNLNPEMCGNLNGSKKLMASQHCCVCGKTFWNFKGWSPCSKTCGNGFKTAEYTCSLANDDCGKSPMPFAQTPCHETCDDDDKYVIYLNEKEEDDCQQKNDFNGTSEDESSEPVVAAWAEAGPENTSFLK